MSLIAYPIMIGAVVWGLFNPLAGALLHVTFLVLFEGWLLSVAYTAKPGFGGTSWGPAEQEIIRKYYLYFRFPFASRHNSSTLSAVTLLTLFWVPWLLFKGLWPLALVIGVNYFLAAVLSAKLNPRFFLHDAVERRGKGELLGEMLLVDAICEKILGDQEDAFQAARAKEKRAAT